MVFKKNGQECNKLHLTLNLGESYSGCGGHNTEAPSVPVPSHTTATAAADSAEPAGDESYMVMNSALTASRMLGAHHKMMLNGVTSSSDNERGRTNIADKGTKFSTLTLFHKNIVVCETHISRNDIPSSP